MVRNLAGECAQCRLTRESSAGDCVNFRGSIQGLFGGGADGFVFIAGRHLFEGGNCFLGRGTPSGRGPPLRGAGQGQLAA